MSIRCKWLGWHKPEKIVWDGASYRSNCSRCGTAIAQDSQGNWFALSTVDPELREFTYPDIPQKPVLDEGGKALPEDDPLARAVNRAWHTGETVVWNEGDPLP